MELPGEIRMPVKRRRHSPEFKAQVLEEALQYGVSVAAVARRHNLNANLIHPTTEIGGVRIRVMMGSAYELSSPVKTFAETLYVEAHLKAGQRLTLPMCEERAIYMAKARSAATAHQ